MIATITGNVVQNEMTAKAQKVTNQPDGPGLRIDKRGEISGIFRLIPGGAHMFRERLAQFQAVDFRM